MPISDAERARRRRSVDLSRTSAALEGQRVTPATQRDQEDYVAGLIDLDELGSRVRGRYGVAEAGCALGRTEDEVLALVGEEQRERFRQWSLMRAHPICTGRAPCAPGPAPSLMGAPFLRGRWRRRPDESRRGPAPRRGPPARLAYGSLRCHGGGRTPRPA